MTAELRLAQLRALDALARLRSYAQAAEELSYTEPAVLLQIRGLEQSLGHTLVRRERKQISLTHAGEQIAGRAVDVLERANRLEQMARGLRGRIVIASGPATAVNWIMPLIARYQRAFPAHQIELHAEDVEGLVAGVADGLYDIAIGGISAGAVGIARFATHRFVLVPWALDEWWLFAPAPIGREGNLMVFDVERLGTPVRVFRYRGSQDWPDDAIAMYISRRLGGPTEVVIQDSVELVRGAVSNGLGLGILPRSVLRAGGAERLVPLFGLEHLRQLPLRLLHRRPHLLASPVRGFLGFLIANRPARQAGNRPGGSHW